MTIPSFTRFSFNSTLFITGMTRLRAFFFFDYMLFINFTNHFTLVKLERRMRPLKHHRLTASVIRVTENLFGGFRTCGWMECTPPYTMNGFNIILLTLDRLVEEGSLIIYRAAGCKLGEHYIRIYRPTFSQ